MHRPDPHTAIDETVSALSDLVRAGKILYWGTSTFPAAELVEPTGRRRRSVVSARTVSNRRIRSSAAASSVTCLLCGQRYSMGVLTVEPALRWLAHGKYRRDTPAPRAVGARQPRSLRRNNPLKLDAVDALARRCGPMRCLAHAPGWRGTSSIPRSPRRSCWGRAPKNRSTIFWALPIWRLDRDTLDRIDAIVAPGADLNPADRGWIRRACSPRRGRRAPGRRP